MVDVIAGAIIIGSTIIAPQPTSVEPRFDCELMRGTQYQPQVWQIERAFFLENCIIKVEPKPLIQVFEKPSEFSGGTNSHLQRIKMCESSGNYQAVNPLGYYGAYQFDLQTWASVGGVGNPINASPAEQDYRAQLLYNSRGSSPWPVCQYE